MREHKNQDDAARSVQTKESGCGPLGPRQRVAPRPDQQKPRKAMTPDFIGPGETPTGDVTASGGPRQEDIEAPPPERKSNQ